MRCSPEPQPEELTRPARYTQVALWAPDSRTASAAPDAEGDAGYAAPDPRRAAALSLMSSERCSMGAETLEAVVFRSTLEQSIVS